MGRLFLFAGICIGLMTAAPPTAQEGGTPPSAGSARGGSTTGAARLTIRDIGPETGFSGSGTGFTFNRDTREVILPSRQRVFRSFNGGGNWSAVDLTVTEVAADVDVPAYPLTEGSYFVRQDPRDPQVLYAVGAHAGQLARSGDFGTTWTQLEDSRPGRIFNFADVAVHEASSNVLLALRQVSWDGPALWRSEDSGATFTPQWHSGLPVERFDPDTEEICDPRFSNIATTPADPAVVYVVQPAGDDTHCPAGVHKSVDGGLTFARLEASPPAIPLQVFPHPTRAAVLFVQTANPSDSAIYRSVDGGASFQLVTGGLGRQNFFVSFDRRNPSWVYVAGQGGVFRSQDGGDTFLPLGLTAEQLGRFASNVNGDPSDSRVIYVNTFNGNFKSVNGGLTFTAINKGWRAAFIRAIGFDHRSDPNLYLATDHGILRTRTRGHDFEPVPHPDILNDTVRLAFAPSNPDMVLAVTRAPSPTGFTERIHRTLDCGQSWTEAIIEDLSDPDGFHPAAMSVDPQDSSNVHLAGWRESTGLGFYKSVDAGATFRRTAGASFTALAIDPIHPNVILGAQSCYGCPWPLHKSVDGGLSFSLIRPAGFSQSTTSQILIDPRYPDDIFVNGAFNFSLDHPDQTVHYVLRSTDGGVTFSPVDAGLPGGCRELVMNPKDPARLYCWAATPSGLSVTSDSGETWSLVPAEAIVKVGGFGDASSTMAINSRRPKLLYLLGSSLLEIEIHEE